MSVEREMLMSVSNELKNMIFSIPGHTWEQFKHCVQYVPITLLNFKQPSQEEGENEKSQFQSNTLELN